MKQSFQMIFDSLKKKHTFMLQCSQNVATREIWHLYMDSSLSIFFCGRLLDKLDFESMSFSLYFLASVPEEETTPEPGTAEAHQYLWTFPRTTLDRSSVFMKMPMVFHSRLGCATVGRWCLKILRNWRTTMVAKKRMDKSTILAMSRKKETGRVRRGISLAKWRGRSYTKIWRFWRWFSFSIPWFLGSMLVICMFPVLGWKGFLYSQKKRQIDDKLSRRDGFGHVAFKVHDVNEICDELDSSGVKFQSHSWFF